MALYKKVSKSFADVCLLVGIDATVTENHISLERPLEYFTMQFSTWRDSRLFLQSSPARSSGKVNDTEQGRKGRGQWSLAANHWVLFTLVATSWCRPAFSGDRPLKPLHPYHDGHALPRERWRCIRKMNANILLVFCALSHIRLYRTHTSDFQIASPSSPVVLVCNLT